MPGIEAYQPLVLDEESSPSPEENANNNTSTVNAENEELENESYTDDKEGIFRDRPWKEGGETAEEAHVGLHQIHSKSSGSASIDSFLDSDWDDDEDEAEIARYHMNFQARKDVPLPAEFRKENIFELLWHAFITLQTNARHRRAARLLNMPSHSRRHQIQAAFVTWCCDGTELAILLALGWMLAWILIGLAAGLGRGWWVTGFILFLIRISSRRSVELLQSRRKRRQRLSATEAVELGQSGIWSDMNQRNSRG
ncbi:hypothetical protein FisN_24Hu245 [Fistulifera solaris]|uniref:Uncharacterized protein n=1 Tax=Fistulifera solaris TaxID=1519565 RepID=A0A1Z5K2P2_FISSO|nr:hypothetical protein FisN_24Hu245 [Fistulifera solaris]|eukprot:GAX20505.1 hypothetical protein FisN_24Hu245 [Fistulifera solaris]